MNAMNHIPYWVFGIFFVLLFLGFQQSKPITMSRGRVLLMPVVMTGLSINAVVQLFGLQLWVTVAWLAGFCLAIAVRRSFKQSVQATFSESKNEFVVQGSWLPLCLMMAVFVLRFISTAGMVRQPELAKSLAFTGLMTFGFGLLSSAFITRSILIFGKAYGPNKVVVA